MKKNVWIINHYATNMFDDRAGRHYWFSENLIKNGYNPTVFCASTNHFSGENIKITEGLYSKKIVDMIPFVFVKTPEYIGNGRKRILNMFSFYKNIIKTAKKFVENHEKPDVIIASSVHPLSLVAGIKLAKFFGVKCVCEVRDLWPESLVAYGSIQKNNIFTKALYGGEHWIYKKADAIVMTWPGGRDYIIDKGWEQTVNLQKVYHISNGLSLESFDENLSKTNYISESQYKDIVYTGSIRKVNNVGLLLDAAKIIKEKNSKVRIVIYGDGNELSSLKSRCKNEEIDNVIFKGKVPKSQIPQIISNSYANLLHNSSTSLDKYGQSQNKLFEYLAAGKCIIQTYTTNFSVLEKYNCGISVKNQMAGLIADSILKICENPRETLIMGENARKASYDYDFKFLTEKLISIIEKN